MVLLSPDIIGLVPKIIFSLAVFGFGLCLGSFLNCLIYWLESKKRKNLWGRSFCPQCGHRLGFWDLIPLFSFVFLRRKCRYCHKPISFQYPLVEISTGLIFLLIFNFEFLIFNEFSIIQFSNLVYYLIVASLLIVVFVYDLKHYLIPDKVIYSAIGIVILFRIWDFNAFLNPLFSALAAAGFFLLVWLVSHGKWMGFGDVELAFFIGLFLGFPKMLVAMFCAFFIGAIIGIGLVCFGRKKLKSRLPFGPFLVGGTFFALFWGQQTINWYLNLFL